MKKVELKTRKLLRKIFGGISLTAMVFIFQACYGMPPDRHDDVKLTGTVTSKTTNLPISGIKISVNEGYNYGFTDENGNFNFYAGVPNWNYERDGVKYTPDKLNISFLDVDGAANGNFADTTIIVNRAHQNELIVNVELREKL